MENSSGFIDFENLTGSTDEKAEIISKEFLQEDEMLNAMITRNNARAEAELLYKSAKDENEKLLLRDNVVHGEYAENVKVKILDILDDYIKKELKQEIELVASLEEIKEEKHNLKLGVIVIVVIGFAVTPFFSMAWLIGIALAIVGYYSGNREQDKKLQKATMAAERIQRYRDAGYRV